MFAEMMICIRQSLTLAYRISLTRSFFPPSWSVEAVDGRRQVVQPLPLRDQRTERLRREGVPAQ